MHVYLCICVSNFAIHNLDYIILYYYYYIPLVGSFEKIYLYFLRVMPNANSRVECEEVKTRMGSV